MNIIQKLLRYFGRDYVVLVCTDGSHLVRPVQWMADQPFATPFTPESRARLMPGGRLAGRCYLIGWWPASDRMAAFYRETT